jgi:tetratricopeptide (TPR) repeat protein
LSGSARVFVSYRREDTRHVAGRLADRLVERFQVFMDMDTIEPGTDFTDVIRRAVNDCDVFLSVIGTQWTTVADERGLRRLDDANDWVVAETAAALQRNAPVIPVLVDGARMPARSELPDVLASLASRQGMTLRHESFSSDVGRLIAAIDKRVRATATTAPTAGQQAAAVNPATVEADYTAGLAAFFAQRWDQAIDLFQRVLSQQPDHQAAADRLAEARRHQQLTTWNSQADRAAAEGRWSDAVVLLENIRSLDPDYPDLTRRLQAATRKRHVAELETDIHTLAAAGQWPAVVAAGQELASLEPNRADPDGLVTRAQAALAESRRLHLSALYTTAGQAEAAGRVNEAIQALEEITRLDPANAEAARRLNALRAQQAAWPQSPPTRSQPTPPQVAEFATPLMQPPTPPGPPDQAALGPAVPPPRQKRFPVWIAAVVAGLVIVAVVVSVVVINALQKGRGGTVGVSVSASVSRGNPTPTPTPTPSSTPKTYNTSNLRTHIPTDIRTSCADYAPPAGDALEVKLVGALRCEPTGAGVPAKVWYFQFPDNAAMDTAYAAYIRGNFTKGNCTKNRQKMDFTTTEKGRKLSGGLLHCYEADGSATFAWTHDYLHIVSFASDSDLSFAAMKKWWEHAGPYRQP